MPEDKIPSKKNILVNELNHNKIRVLSLTEDEQRKVIEDKLENEDFKRLPHRCTKCGRWFMFKQKLDNHMEAHGQMCGEFECPICFLRFNCKKSYNKHKLGHKNQYQCVACNHLSPCKCRMLNHYKRLHEGIVVEYKCKYCEKKFRTQKTHKWHEKSHEGVKPECDTCGKTFTTSEVRDQHKLYACSKCPLRFHIPSLLRLHDLAKHSEKSFACELCEKLYNSKSTLVNHIRKVHEGLKKGRDFICDICETGFRTKHILLNHIRTHTGNGPFMCELCGTPFRQMAVLNTHNNLVHLKIKRVVNRKKKIK